ncbi:DUF3160 domain-containing protein [Hymenobacter chitinivorans]|uniref:YARHG domain-containing protein n=1 Tax=Hymenobacter chitinivorans DSM 11115 TaxID=1121954 RepID=A0A2M9BLU4_9BACT|nr:DUF3160 domain-containing protein [Hymenobacter chitinivorans]PJJ58913.1 YARHG domain-containing protein [Hymenobacter chitinivorans DSM 11115]
MNRNSIIAVALVILVALGAGLFFWRRPAAQVPAPAAAKAAATPAPQLTDSAHDNGFGEIVPVVAAADKRLLTSYYQRPYIKEYYTEEYYEEFSPESAHEAPLPTFDYDQNLDGKSYLDLLLLRNTVYARNGYCFLNATARKYFSKQNWYRPVWSEVITDSTGRELQPADSLLPVPLDPRELAFVQRVHARETELLRQREARQNGYAMIGFDYVVNQRDLLVTPLMRTVLNGNNFVLVPTREEQIFFIYDQNQYDHTPNFITTDLVLQLLHKYLNGILSDVEEQRLGPVVATVLSQGVGQAQQLAQRAQQPLARDAAEWAVAYYSVGRALLTGAPLPASGAYADAATREVAMCTAAEGRQSVLLQDSLFDYAVCKPRGMYTRNDTTRRYFRTVKWLNSAPVFLDSDAGVLRAVALAQALAGSKSGQRGFENLTQVLDVLVGDEDNRSLTHLLRLLKTRYAGQSLDQLAAPATLAAIRRELIAAGSDRIRVKGASAHAMVAVERPKLLFTAGRYTFDGEILSRLTNVLRSKPRQDPPRPFPKGLDVFATFGNRTAQDILLTQYKEAANWPAYPDTLRALQRQFAGFKGWDQNLYTKTMQMLLALNAPAPAPQQLPLFARTPAWQKRNLSTALGGWAELKHDLLLYTEQPSGAEAGGPSGGPPSPRHLSYVEPNLPFWEAALALLTQQDRSLTRLRANTEHLTGLNKEIRELVTRLRDLSAKEIKHERLTYDEMEKLSWIGGEVESLTFRILKTQQLPDRERQMALVADVYSFNQTVLEEAVGAVDALYVVVDIEGAPVLARGGVFSYYEFTSPARLTDEEWQAQLARQAPARPQWLRGFIVPVKELATQGGSTLD